MPVVVIVGYGPANHALRERQMHRPHSGCTDYTMRQGVNAARQSAGLQSSGKTADKILPHSFSEKYCFGWDGASP